MNFNSNSFKKNNYDYDSYDENENKTNKKITMNVNIIKSKNNSNHKSEKNKNKKNENNYIPIISISNFGDTNKDDNEKKNNNQNKMLEGNNKEEISKINKTKLEIENIQKIISNTVESLNINLNNEKFNSINDSQKIKHIDVTKKELNKDLLSCKPKNINRNMTYSRKI